MTPGVVLASVFGALWEGTLLAVVAMGLLVLCRVRAPRARYVVFSAVLVKCVVPAAAVFSAAAPVESALRPYWSVPADAAAFARGLGPVVAPVPAEPLSDALGWIAVVAWATTALWLLARRAAATAHMASVVDQSTTVTRGRVAEALARALRVRGASCRVRVALSPYAGSPFVWGTRQPLVVLPAALVDELDDAELEAVLQHELSHVGWFDGITASLSGVAVCLAWPHPLAWWLARQAEQEREFACDREAIAFGRSSLPLARGLAKAVRSAATHVAATTPAMASGDVARRLDRLLRGGPEGDAAWRQRVVYVGLALACVLVVAGANPCLRP